MTYEACSGADAEKVQRGSTEPWRMFWAALRSGQIRSGGSDEEVFSHAEGQRTRFVGYVIYHRQARELDEEDSP